jgi:hypothetical protein
VTAPRRLALTFAAGLAVGVVATIAAADLSDPGPDPVASVDLEMARRTADLAREEAQAAWDRYAAQGDTIEAYRDTVRTVRTNARLVASVAAQRASTAETALRHALDSLGASTEALDTLVAAHAQRVAAVEAERDVLARENAMLWGRVELADTVIARLDERAERTEAVGMAEARLREVAEDRARASSRREKVAYGVVAVLALREVRR